MQEPGQKLRRIRERLHLRYRDVEQASHRIAHFKGNDGFIVGLSRLADIENRGTLPSVYRLYSLCVIYALDFNVVLRWYGVDIQKLPSDSAMVDLDQTRLIEFEAPKIEIDLPVALDGGFDLRRTSFLSRQVERWGRLPLALLNSGDVHQHRYAFLGTDDWSMHPILAPGSFLHIDPTRTRVASAGWTNEYERPIYFLEHRDGFRCGWCTERDGVLILQTHAASSTGPELLRYPGEAEIIGQVVGVAMRLDSARRRHTRS